MESSHAAAIADLEKICFSSPWDEVSVASELSNELSLWLVALDGENVVGYVGSQSVMGEADMMNIAVHPDYRRQGLGREIVGALQREAQARGVTSVFLEVRVSNVAARRLYEEMGFSVIGVRKGFYRHPSEDGLAMEWRGSLPEKS